MIGGDLKRREKVRKIFTQVVNSLTAKMEIGGPMASLYILGGVGHCFAWQGTRPFGSHITVFFILTELPNYSYPSGQNQITDS
jgi:hypothetical protein